MVIRCLYVTDCNNHKCGANTRFLSRELSGKLSSDLRTISEKVRACPAPDVAGLPIVQLDHKSKC